MTSQNQSRVRDICREHGSNPVRLLDIARAVQSEFRGISQQSIDAIADEVRVPRVTVEACVSFYSFLSVEQKGEITIRLCDDVPDRLAGYATVRDAFIEALGIPLGGTTPDGRFTLERTAHDRGPYGNRATQALQQEDRVAESRTGSPFLDVEKANHL